MWVFLATEILFFGVLFAGYTYCRVRFPEAFAEASRHTDCCWARSKPRCC